jgi:hypothetical protein
MADAGSHLVTSTCAQAYTPAQKNIRPPNHAIKAQFREAPASRQSAEKPGKMA